MNYTEVASSLECIRKVVRQLTLENDSLKKQVTQLEQQLSGRMEPLIPTQGLRAMEAAQVSGHPVLFDWDGEMIEARPDSTAQSLIESYNEAKGGF